MTQNTGKTPEELLKEFYQDILKWIEARCPADHPYYTTSFGLCFNLERWKFENNLSVGTELDNLQYRMFAEAGLHPHCPFEEWNEYCKRKFSGTMFENPQRLAWVRDHAR